VISVVGAGWLFACSFPEYQLDWVSRVCSDGVTSALETGVDCGGGCDPCNTGQVCERQSDCASSSCVDGICQQPSCTDRLVNGAETDVDCGGPCAPCGPGKSCVVAIDCRDGVCQDTNCQRPACDDQVQNGSETGLDCGSSCRACDNGMGCEQDRDCESGHCQGNVCVAPGCTDTLLNGTESDVDCGGEECKPCEPGSICKQARDCGSRICDEAECTAYGCTDRVMNGTETDQDCGGSNCPGCGELERCNAGTDCASGVCLSGQCVPAAPTGETLSRDGWQAFASDTYPDDDPNEVLDSEGNRWTSGAVQRDGMMLEVDMREPRAFFQVLFTCTEFPDDAAASFEIFLSNDLNYGAPAARQSQGGCGYTFDTARIARFIKIVLRSGKGKYWWSINEFLVKK
jgi:hypothetical protein